jgi:malonyl-CoA decarboxylase
VSLLGELLGSVFERRAGFFGTGVADTRPMDQLVTDLVAADGEESARELARAIFNRYDAMDDAEKRGFFLDLAKRLNIAPDMVRETLSAYEADPSKPTYRAFMQAAEPPRQELIRRLNRVQGATEKLVKMRADLLRLTKEDAALGALDLDFRHLFASWFNRGFLVLRPISWESPAHVLEKIILYEAVHAIGSWDDLRRRLEPEDRRCFAFFHPAMPDEPLVFVEVALTEGTPDSIQGLLAEARDEMLPQNASTAVFYSISNCQAGLEGISFGDSLIKQVVADLSLALPNLKTFVTLSPLPGFADWLEKTQALPGEAEQLRSLGAWYLTEAKRGDGRPLDPVARFHLRNGARIEAVHTEADTSPKGQRQSHGLMVNYLYDLNHVAANHELFAAGKGIAASGRVKRLAGAAQKLLAPETTA